MRSNNNDETRKESKIKIPQINKRADLSSTRYIVVKLFRFSILL